MFIKVPSFNREVITFGASCRVSLDGLRNRCPLFIPSLYTHISVRPMVIIVGYQHKGLY